QFWPDNPYRALLEDELFRGGEVNGRLRTALTMLTDMLIELNALEIFYQKPSAKSIVPQEIESLRKKVEAIKELIQETLGTRMNANVHQDIHQDR
ncbi:MAG TPA: hypothetical protein VGM92_11220, partial [Candidatus Kapabacteria bacterium]